MNLRDCLNYRTNCLIHTDEKLFPVGNFTENLYTKIKIDDEGLHFVLDTMLDGEYVKYDQIIDKVKSYMLFL